MLPLFHATRNPAGYLAVKICWIVSLQIVVLQSLRESGNDFATDSVVETLPGIHEQNCRLVITTEI